MVSSTRALVFSLDAYTEPSKSDLGRNLPFSKASSDHSPQRGKVPYAVSSRRYMHNGLFVEPQEVVHFYNTRDAIPDHSSTDSGRPNGGESELLAAPEDRITKI